MEVEATIYKLSTQHITKVIDGISTEITMSKFTNRIFILVSQIGTMGTVLEAYNKESLSGAIQSEIHVRLGRRDDPLLLVYARQFLEHFGAKYGLPIAASIGLKDRSAKTFEVVMNSLKELDTKGNSAP